MDHPISARQTARNVGGPIVAKVLPAISGLLLLGLFGATTKALAQAECGTSSSVSCAPGLYPNGIYYENESPAVGNIPNLSVTLQSGVTVDKNGAGDGVAVEQPGNLSLSTQGSVNIFVRGVGVALGRCGASALFERKLVAQHGQRFDSVFGRGSSVEPSPGIIGAAVPWLLK